MASEKRTPWVCIWHMSHLTDYTLQCTDPDKVEKYVFILLSGITVILIVQVMLINYFLPKIRLSVES